MECCLYLLTTFRSQTGKLRKCAELLEFHTFSQLFDLQVLTAVTSSIILVKSLILHISHFSSLFALSDLQNSIRIKGLAVPHYRVTKLRKSALSRSFQPFGAISCDGRSEKLFVFSAFGIPGTPPLCGTGARSLCGPRRKHKVFLWFLQGFHGAAQCIGWQFKFIHEFLPWAAPQKCSVSQCF